MAVIAGALMVYAFQDYTPPNSLFTNRRGQEIEEVIQKGRFTIKM